MFVLRYVGKLQLKDNVTLGICFYAVQGQTDLVKSFGCFGCFANAEELQVQLVEYTQQRAVEKSFSACLSRCCRWKNNASELPVGVSLFSRCCRHVVFLIFAAWIRTFSPLSGQYFAILLKVKSRYCYKRKARGGSDTTDRRFIWTIL
jgi:hypothetical protein